MEVYARIRRPSDSTENVRGLLAGTTALAGIGAAQEGFSLNIRQEKVDPDTEILTAEVRIPEPQFHPQEVPEAYHLGLRDYALVDGDLIYINETEKFAQPVKVREIPGSHWLMQFPTERIPLEEVIEAEDQRAELILAVPGNGWFPGSQWVPGNEWDTDEVGLGRPITY